MRDSRGAHSVADLRERRRGGDPERRRAVRPQDRAAGRQTVGHLPHDFRRCFVRNGHIPHDEPMPVARHLALRAPCGRQPPHDLVDRLAAFGDGYERLPLPQHARRQQAHKACGETVFTIEGESVRHLDAAAHAIGEQRLARAAEAERTGQRHVAVDVEARTRLDRALLDERRASDVGDARAVPASHRRHDDAPLVHDGCAVGGRRARFKGVPHRPLRGRHHRHVARISPRFNETVHAVGSGRLLVERHGAAVRQGDHVRPSGDHHPSHHANQHALPPTQTTVNVVDVHPPSLPQLLSYVYFSHRRPLYQLPTYQTRPTSYSKSTTRTSSTLTALGSA